MGKGPITGRKHQYDVFYEVLALYKCAEEMRFERLINEGAHPFVIKREIKSLNRQIKTLTNRYEEETRNDTNNRITRTGEINTSPSTYFKSCSSDNSGSGGSNAGREVCSEKGEK